MFETPEERVKALKAGIDGKTIEKLYLIDNNFKLFPMLFEDVEINIESKGLTNEFYENKFLKQNSIIDFPHLFERISMIGIPQFIHRFRIFPS